MTKAEAEALRAMWKLHGDPLACVHLVHIEELNEDGVSTGFFVCNLCGESMPPEDLAA